MNATAHAIARTSPAQEVRTIRAPNTRAALQTVKALLGPDAVILSTREVGGLFGREIEITAAAPEAPPPAAPENAVRAYAAAAKEPDTQAELARLRGLVEQLQTRTPAPSGPTGFGLYPERAEAFRTLATRGVDEDLAVELVQQAVRAGAGAVKGSLMEEVRDLLRRRLRPAAAPWRPRDPGETGQRVLALIGPTGVGKTTTIAKIAARALLEGQLKVGLITVDTYRLGASDQLARYGKIMGLRTHVARDEAALADAVAAFRDMDLVLIDTAGRSDAAAREEQHRLLRTIPGVELHLVLSAASGARELRAMGRRYAEVKPHALVFTKLDEADGPGALLSAVVELPKPITCVTDGQRVPEDIHPATSQSLTSWVVGS